MTVLRLAALCAFACAATAAAAGDVPVLPVPVTTVNVSGPWSGPVEGPRGEVADFNGGQPRTNTPMPDARGNTGGAVAAAPVVAGLTVAERARLAARIEAELASRTR